MLHTASTIIAPTTDMVHPAVSLGPYHPISWPRYVPAKAPTMPRTAVITKPDGSFGPGWIHFAITPTIAPVMIVQMMCSTVAPPQTLHTDLLESDGALQECGWLYPMIQRGGLHTGSPAR